MEKRGLGNCHGSWDKSKNLYPLRKCMIPNSATARATGTMRPQAKWFMVPYGYLIWNLGDFSMHVWVLAVLSLYIIWSVIYA